MSLELERENLTQKLDLNQKELEYKNKELTTNIMYLTKKNRDDHQYCQRTPKCEIRF